MIHFRSQYQKGPGVRAGVVGVNIFGVLFSIGMSAVFGLTHKIASMHGTSHVLFGLTVDDEGAQKAIVFSVGPLAISILVPTTEAKIKAYYENRRQDLMRMLGLPPDFDPTDLDQLREEMVVAELPPGGPVN